MGNITDQLDRFYRLVFEAESKMDLYEEKMREIENSRVGLKAQLKAIENENKANATFEQVLDIL